MLTAPERLIIIHIREYINRLPLWKRSMLIYCIFYLCWARNAVSVTLWAEKLLRWQLRGEFHVCNYESCDTDNIKDYQYVAITLWHLCYFATSYYVCMNLVGSKSYSLSSQKINYLTTTSIHNKCKFYGSVLLIRQ